MPDLPKWTNRDLRVVNNFTREWDGGFTVEHDDLIIAGPYPTKQDAKTAKRCLVAGEPLPAYLNGVSRFRG